MTDGGQPDPLEFDREAWLEKVAVRNSNREKIAARLQAEGMEDEAEKLRECGQEIGLTCTGCGNETRGRVHCKRRWCPSCQPMLSFDRSQAYEKIASACKWPLHVTLTITNKKSLLADDFRKLLANFKKLRRTELWKRSVKGGIVSLEVTSKGKGWHPHLHVLCDCRWLGRVTREPQQWWSREKKAAAYQGASRELHDAWAGLVNQKSASVKVVRRSAVDVVREVVKYAVKGSDLAECQGTISEVINAMKKTRLMTAFGSFYGKVTELTKEQEKMPCRCGQCGEEGSILPTAVAEKMMVGSAAERTERKMKSRFFDPTRD